MNLFKSRPAAPPEKIQRIKSWVCEALCLSSDVPISISQLQCHEPDCPPIETVIVVMSQPRQTFKIHAAIADICQTNITQAVSSPSPDDACA